MITAPICVPCERETIIEKNGVVVCIHAPFGPYQLYRADLWLCPTCDNPFLKFANQPFAEHFQPGFAEELEKVEYHVRN